MSVAGTPEADWIGSATLRHTPARSTDQMLDGAERLVVVAPHPDDETLSAGGLIAAAAERDCPVLVVLVTAGEASHDGSLLWSRGALAIQRLEELNRALALLDAAKATVVRLSVADGAVRDSVEIVAGRLRLELRASDVVVCPWRRDGHPDHEATADAVLAVAPDIGCRVLEAPIWMWHWRTPECAQIEWHRMVRVELSPHLALRKASALRAFVSQRDRDPTLDRTPIADASVLAHFERDFEAFFDHVA